MKTPEEFMDYFRSNYPGPGTIINDPDWHAPKIYRAALHASPHKELVAALELALALFDKDHCIDHFNWGKSCLSADNIRELNETPFKLQAALVKARGEQEAT